MSSKLQLTTLAVLVSAALPAQAALYKVVEVDSGLSAPKVSEITEYYGTAIQSSGGDASCFTVDCGEGDDYSLAGETRNRAAGFSYREEVPFAMDNAFGYIEDNYDGFEYYCFDQLGYSTCEYWADTQYNKGWSIELGGSTTSNSIAFTTNSGTIAISGINTVINSFSKVSGSVNTIGNFSDSTSRNLPISGDTLTDTTIPTAIIWKQGRQWASDGAYTVGSVSSKTGIENERYYYYSKPAVWNGVTLTAINWAGGTENDSDVFAQGSMRDLYIEDTTFYGVGYNNYNDQHMNATIFKGDTTNLAGITSIQISGAQVEISNDNVNSNSVATNINNNLVVVGQAKRSGNYPQNGAAANRLFVTSVNSPTAHFLDTSDGGIFFNGAGGVMGGINNFNEIVGRVDAQTHREYDGKQRRQRAFIYPYGTVAQGSVDARKAIFNNKAWIIDDLTNDGSISGNNQYRIYDASDINDAGVISATATMCSGGYDSTAHDAYCGDGNGIEKIVAVKLVPISDPAVRKIEIRDYENNTTERQGGSFGFGALTLLGLFGFMRKRIK
ncbi:DUF3466 family protein [Aliivibrio salmonicida]|uniref:DUF3466 family protein n=1 Tax=Aliivibrio salmonicida TaxID=40269 RepID=UPI00406CE217